jgi:hypothetical protein
MPAAAETGYGAMYIYLAFMGLLALVLFLWAVTAFLDGGDQ